MTEPDALSPPKIKSISIVGNPFPDIIPRITAAEKRAQQRARARLHSVKGKKENDARVPKSQLPTFVLVTSGWRTELAFKNVKLLSFGEDEGVDAEEGEPAVPKRRT